MRIGILACEIFKDELDRLTEGDSDIVHREYLDFGLHLKPVLLRETVVSKANELKGSVDAVFLGYCFCQNLMGVTQDIEVPAVMMHTDDCIGALMTPQAYAEEKRVCAGTWFNTPGWALQGVEGPIREIQLDTMEGVDPMDLLHMLFDGYSRCLYVDTGSEDNERFLTLSKGFAATMGLRHECSIGGTAMLEEGLRRTKELADQE